MTAPSEAQSLRDAAISVISGELIVRRDYDSVGRACDWFEGVEEAVDALLAPTGPIGAHIAKIEADRREFAAAYITVRETAVAEEARAEKAEAERDAAREMAGLSWTAPDVDAWGRHAEEKGAVGVRDRMNRLLRRACLAEEDARQLRNEAERYGQDHQAIADATLTARIADLEAALRPFAKLDFSFDGFSCDPAEMVVLGRCCGTFWPTEHAYLEKALRAARSALSNKDAGHE